MIKPFTPDTLNIPAGRVHSVGDLTVAPDDRVPQGARRIVEEQLRASVEEGRRRQQEQADAVAKLGDEYRKERRALLGPEGYERYRGLTREWRHRPASAPLPRRATRRTEGEQRRIRDEQQQKLMALLGELGVDAGRLTALDHRMAERLGQLLAAESGGGRERPEPRVEMSEPIHADKTGPYTEFTPPYSNLGLWSYTYRDTDQYSFTGSFVGNDAKQGILGSRPALEIWDAGDSDTGKQIFRSLFGFWYQLPKNTKSLNIFMEVELVNIQYHQYLKTEFWGASHAGFWQNNSYFIGTYGVGSIEVPVPFGSWHAGWQGTDLAELLEGTWDFGPSSSSGTWWVSFPTSIPAPTPPPDGNWIWLWLGLQNDATMWVDDEDGQGFMDCRLKFHRIRIQPVS